MKAEAYAAYDSALVYNPNNIATLNNYAYYLSVERKDLDKAEEMSYRTVKAEPENATYLDTYAWILFEKERYTEARIYIEQAMRNGGDTSQVIVEHCGDIYYMLDEKDKALEYWKKAEGMGSQSGRRLHSAHRSRTEASETENSFEKIHSRMKTSFYVISESWRLSFWRRPALLRATPESRR